MRKVVVLTIAAILLAAGTATASVPTVASARLAQVVSSIEQGPHSVTGSVIRCFRKECPFALSIIDAEGTHKTCLGSIVVRSQQRARIRNGIVCTTS